MYFIHTVPAVQPSPCPGCGISLLEITQTGRVGCPECYRHYSQRLNHHIRRIHGPAVHTGGIPKSADGRIAQKRRIAELRSDLQHAIEQQEFERCAELRDQINSLSGEREGSAPGGRSSPAPAVLDTGGEEPL
jgi:protein arginine kinase activator